MTRVEKVLLVVAVATLVLVRRCPVCGATSWRFSRRDRHRRARSLVVR